MKLGNSSSKELDISDASVPIAQIPLEDLPKCPQCQAGLLRPSVVWFGEALPLHTLAAVQEFIEEPRKIDLIMVIGTSAKVYPAAGYVDIARERGAKVAVINMDKADMPRLQGTQTVDWFFEGDAGIIVPEILKAVVGEV